MSASACIQTRSGVLFRPLAPVVADIRIDDIAHALSHQCRFSGHTREHYSVAEHSVRVSELVERLGYDRSTQLWALLHDASEAYLVDLPSPLKNDPTFGDAYKSVEARLMRAVCERFDLPYEEPLIVRVADATLCATEARDLMSEAPGYWSKINQPPLEETIVPWSAETARRNFISRFTRVAE